MERDPADAVAPGMTDRFRQGDPAALEDAYRRWAPMVYALAVRSLGDDKDAEDVVQQVFVSAWRGRANLRPEPEALPRWLIGITRHRIADRHAARAREQRTVLAAARVASLPVTDAPLPGRAEHLDLIILRDAVAALFEPRRTVVSLVFFAGLHHSEVAERLGMPLGTVKSHVRRGLLQLRDQLERMRDE